MYFLIKRLNPLVNYSFHFSLAFLSIFIASLSTKHSDPPYYLHIFFRVKSHDHLVFSEVKNEQEQSFIEFSWTAFSFRWKFILNKSCPCLWDFPPNNEQKLVESLFILLLEFIHWAFLIQINNNTELGAMLKKQEYHK